MTQITEPGKLEEGCLRCLSYFGIFQYPLTAEEVHRFHPYPSDPEPVRNALETLTGKGEIYRYDIFFLPEDDPDWVKERKKGNQKALELLGMTGRYAGIIASFPFVRAIAVSGSLSKFYASEDPDIDYFIITDANRLWIARSLLHLFKKLTFITGHEHYFCMNYFIDTEAMSISHPNRYAAIETVTLLPVFNPELIYRFEKENAWTERFLPNHPGIMNDDYLLKRRGRPIKRMMEGILNVFFPERLNRFLMNLTDRKWRKKWAGHGYSKEDYNRAFQTELHISKNHPADYEKKVLDKIKSNETIKATP